MKNINFRNEELDPERLRNMLTATKHRQTDSQVLSCLHPPLLPCRHRDIPSPQLCSLAQGIVGQPRSCLSYLKLEKGQDDSKQELARQTKLQKGTAVSQSIKA